MQVLTKETFGGMLAAVAAVMAEQSATLCEMDARMGDGDLGLTMKKGFAAMHGAFEEMDEPDLGKRIAKSALKMASAVPSTMGTLMSSGMMQGGKNVVGKESLDAADLVAFLEGYAAGIQNRGKCVRGERTVLDAIGAAAEAAATALREDPSATPEQVISAARRGAEEGLEATRRMVPKYGKAAVHAAKAVGEIDQGAFAGCCLIRAMAEYIGG